MPICFVDERAPYYSNASVSSDTLFVNCQNHFNEFSTSFVHIIHVRIDIERVCVLSGVMDKNHIKWHLIYLSEITRLCIRHKVYYVHNLHANFMMNLNWQAVRMQIWWHCIYGNRFHSNEWRWRTSRDIYIYISTTVYSLLWYCSIKLIKLCVAVCAACEISAIEQLQSHSYSHHHMPHVAATKSSLCAMHTAHAHNHLAEWKDCRIDAHTANVTPLHWGILPNDTQRRTDAFQN